MTEEMYDITDEYPLVQKNFSVKFVEQSQYDRPFGSFPAKRWLMIACAPMYGPLPFPCVPSCVVCGGMIVFQTRGSHFERFWQRWKHGLRVHALTKMGTISSAAQVLLRLRKEFKNNFVFPTWACAAGFTTNNNSNNFSRKSGELTE